MHKLGGIQYIFFMGIPSSSVISTVAMESPPKVAPCGSNRRTVKLSRGSLVESSLVLTGKTISVSPGGKIIKVDTSL